MYTQELDTKQDVPKTFVCLEQAHHILPNNLWNAIWCLETEKIFIKKSQLKIISNYIKNNFNPIS